MRGAEWTRACCLHTPLHRPQPPLHHRREEMDHSPGSSRRSGRFVVTAVAVDPAGQTLLAPDSMSMSMSLCGLDAPEMDVIHSADGTSSSLPLPSFTPRQLSGDVFYNEYADNICRHPHYPELLRACQENSDEGLTDSTKAGYRKPAVMLSPRAPRQNGAMSTRLEKEVDEFVRSTLQRMQSNTQQQRKIQAQMQAASTQLLEMLDAPLKTRMDRATRGVLQCVATPAAAISLARLPRLLSLLCQQLSSCLCNAVDVVREALAKRNPMKAASRCVHVSTMP